MTLESDILKKIVPSKEDVERINGVAKRLKEKVQSYMDANGIDAELKFVGSYSKGTYLSNPDLDLFIMFPVGTSLEDLVKVGLKIGEDVLHGSRMYAEHPYTSAVFEGVDVDLVPNIHIKNTDNLVTAVDRTPFHTEFVLNTLQPGQNDQIRLLKKFMKGIGAYGAEPNVRGFSGYLCELLVLKYGSFQNVLEAAAATWREGIELSMGKHDKPLEGAMVFYDPVDGKRNVASAVHIDTLYRSVVAARAYLKEPSERFFFPEQRIPLTREDMISIVEKTGMEIVSVVFDKPDIVDDNIYSQLWKTQYAITAKLNHFGFNSMRAVQTATENNLIVSCLIERSTLPKMYRHEGPAPCGRSSNGFIDRWDSEAAVKPFISEGKWTAVIPRQYTEAKQMLVSEMKQLGIGRELSVESAKVFDTKESLEHVNDGLLTELLVPKYPWQN